MIEPATPPGSPISPHPGRNARIALILALLIAAGLVPLLEALDRRLREPEELEELSDAPLLGTIPDAAFPGRGPGRFVHEAFQTLRAGLTYFNIDRTLGDRADRQPRPAGTARPRSPPTSRSPRARTGAT